MSRDSLNLLLNQSKTWKQDSSAVNKMNMIAQSYHFDRDIPDSVYYWSEKALQLALKLKYNSGIAYAYYFKAQYYNAIENDDEMTSHLLKALDYYSKLNSIESVHGIAKIYMQLSIIHFKLKNAKEAIYSINEAIRICEKHGITPSTTYIYLKGVYLLEDNQPEKALPFLEKALALRLAEKSEKRIMEARTYLAQAYGELGQNQKAEELFRLAKASAMKLGDPEAIMMTYMKEGAFHLANKNYDSAEEDFVVSLKVVGGDVLKRLAALELLAELYAETDRYDKAYSMLQDYINEQRFSNVKEIARKLAALRIKSDLAKKQTEIELLEAKNRNDKLVSYGLGIVALLIAITAIISYKRFTFKRDANRKLSQANQELMQTLEDLQLAEQQLLQAEKMASLGRVTAGIAHELRNPLNFIHNFATVASEATEEMLKANPEEKELLAEDLRTAIEKIKFHGDKAEQIITTMLRHGKDKILDTQAVSLHELIDESVTIATKNFSFKHEGFQCKIEQPESSDIRIRVNPKSIPLVLGNLIDNAMYSVMQKSRNMMQGFIPAIQLHHEFIDKGLVLEIEDNGVGLPKNDGNEIFEPFYTTKPTGHGTGLGLSICYEILKAHGATISVRNNTLGGATFSILFPSTLIIN